LSIVILTTFTLLTLKGGFLLIRAEIIDGAATGDDGVEQIVSIIAFNGFHVMNIVYAALIAIFIGVVSKYGLVSMYDAIITDIINKREKNADS